VQALVSRSASLIAFVLLLFLIVWLPIPWGSNRIWSSLVMSGATSIILVFWSISRLFSVRAKHDWNKNQIVALGLLGLWLVYLFLQTVPIPFELLRLISSKSYEAYSVAGDRSTGAISLDISSTQFALLRYATYVAIFGLTWALVNSKNRLLALVTTVFVAGVLESILGIGLWSAGKSLVPHSLSQGQWSRTTGTFVNRNHYACHLALAFCAGIGLLIMKRGIRVRTSGVYLFAGSLLDNVFNGRVLIIAGLVVVFCALLLSGSAGAFLALIAALGVVFTLNSNYLGRSLRLTGVAGFVIVIAGLAILFTGGGELWSRALQGDIGLNTRIEQWLVTWNLIEQFPLFGVGAGNYAVVFPGYHDESLPRLHYDHVHNDFLELLANQGMVGFVLLACAILFVGSKLISRYRKSNNHLKTGAIFASLSGMFVMLIHGLVEFNFHIPANAAYFFVLMGIGMSAREYNSKRQRPKRGDV